MLATQTIARTNQAFCIEAPLRALFEAPTIAGFAVYVDATRRLGESSSPPLVPVPREGVLPLSHAQQRLWFMQQMDPTNPLYHFAVAVKITGPFDANSLEASLNAIVHRHESLRTVFREEWGELQQEIHSELKVKLDLEWVENELEDVCASGLLQRMREAVAIPFDLAGGPLVRVTLYRPQTVRHASSPVCAVLLCFHHIVFDGWSFGVFLKEFAALYPAMRNGDDPSLPRLRAQYADYAVWQRNRMQSASLARQLDYWIEQLKGAPAILELPVDRPRSLDTGDAAGSYEFDLTGLRSVLDEFDRQNAVTPFMTMLAAFVGLLRYLSGAADLVIGADIANRQRREFEPLIGFFINLVALRIKMDSDPSFSELLAQVREVTLGAYDHQDFPFEKLVETLRPERSRLHAAIFQVKLVFHNVPLMELDIPELRFEAIPLEPPRTELDLVLHVFEDHQKLRAGFEYRKGLFEAATVSKFAELLELLLQRVVAEPSIRLSTLMNLLAERDRAIRGTARSEQLACRMDRLQAAKRRSVQAGK